jgi:hypothetical protein
MLASFREPDGGCSASVIGSDPVGEVSAHSCSAFLSGATLPRFNVLLSRVLGAGWPA